MRRFIFWTICFLGTSLECFAATTIGNVDLTVDGTRFYFDVVVNDAGDFNAFRIATEGNAFNTNIERIQFNFDGTTGALTTVADVETFGTPSFDRWTDGSITDLTLTNLGSTNWQITGSVLHGNNPYIAGDIVSDVTNRSSNGEPHLSNVVVGQAITAPPPSASTEPVPALSPWALIVLSMLFGLVVFANRKRLT